MNDQDRDLIIALAEGSLGTTQAADASARIDADPKLASEYAIQVAAIAHLHSLEHPQMTSAERTTLHENLAAQLGFTHDVAPVVPAKPKMPWWRPVFGLATAAVVVTAIVILPGVLSQDSADTAFTAATDLASEEPRTETTAAAGGAAESSNDDTAALAQDGNLSVYETDSVELDELLDAAKGADSPTAVQRQLSSYSFTSTIDLESDEVQQCIKDLDADLPNGIETILVLGVDSDDEMSTVHLGFDFGNGVEDGLSFVLETCTLVEHSSQG